MTRENGEATACASSAVEEGQTISRRGAIFSKARPRPASLRRALNLFAARPASAHDDDDPPRDSGRPGRRYLIRGGSIMSMDPQVGDLVRGDVLVEGKKILAIGPNLHSGNVDVIDARGRIVMPGFIDTHHHQAWTAIRSSIPDSILIDDGTGTPSAQQNYFANVLAGLPGRPASPVTTGRRMSTSANWSAASRSSTTASPPCTTSRRSITRRSTPTPP